MVQPVPDGRFDAIVIGTGFAGAVTACRLTEANLNICVLERGKRYKKQHFPINPAPVIPSVEHASPPGEPLIPDAGRLLWMLGNGLWDVRDLGEIVVAQAAAYGGGSLLYANVHLRPPEEAFKGWPEQYTKEKLDPYFDLAAYMLDVQPLPPEFDVAKTTQLESAAAELGRPCFRPPLAINFEHVKGGKKNRYGREQGGCQLRGECCFGCGAMAKNTLDLNYLAAVEKTGCADIRTLSEVVSIEKRRDGYKVEYRDLNTGIPDQLEPPIEARHVFLCAGAVNSTELLLRSRVIKKLPCRGSHLGEGFYTNADSIGVAFDSENLQEADRGPTITSALLYEDDEHWLLFEDGGLPTELEPFLGVFRSPLWLGRNRFWEGDGPPSSAQAPRIGFAMLPYQSLADALPERFSAAIQARSPLLGELAEGLAAIGRGLRRAEWLAVPGQGAVGGKEWRLLPDQLVEAHRVNRGRLFEHVVAAAEPFIASVLDNAAETAEGRLKVEKLLERFLPNKPELKGVKDVDLTRRLLNLAFQLTWGGEGDMVRDVANQLLDFVVPEKAQILERATLLLLWALDFRLSDSRTGILLCMGRDSGEGGALSIDFPQQPAVGSVVTGRTSNATGLLVSSALRSGSWAWNDAAGTLTLAKKGSGKFQQEESLLVGDRVIGTVSADEIELAPVNPVYESGDGALKRATERVRLAAVSFGAASTTAKHKAAALRRLLGAPLRATTPGLLETPERAVQERMLRDIAKSKAWGAELRTDPVSAFMLRRLTVHSQGSCAMGSVTTPDGEVVGCPGLYVMDAAAFPKSVGVNPSATIAAIAEYKVEKFIRAHGKDEEWCTDDFAGADKWMSEKDGRRQELDPLAGISRTKREPTSQPIGISFKEKMTGRGGPPSQIRDHGIETVLRAKIDDLAYFIESYRAGGIPDIALDGCSKVDWTHPNGTLETLKVRPGGSYIRLFQKADGSGDGGRTRLIVYRLVLDRGGRDCVLEGKKTIRDDVDFDLWTDVTRLDFELKQGPAVLLEGMLQLTASDFYGEGGQLRSFEATNTKDSIRRTCALTAFGKLFLEHIADAYVPELDALGDVARSIVERMHV